LVTSNRHGVDEVRTLFDAIASGLDRADARARIWAARSALVACHTIVLSPRGTLEIDAEDELRALVRATMDRLTGHVQRASTLPAAPDWVGAIHRDTGHPHGHVVLAGGVPDPRGGATRPVVLYRREYAVMRAEAARAARVESDRGASRALVLRYYVDGRPTRDRERERGRERGIDR